MFKEFGEIESANVAKNEDGSLKNYGYVSFKDSKDAENALESMDKKPLADGSFLMVNRHISKRENEMGTGSMNPIQ